MRVAQEPVDGPKALDAASLDAAGNPATTVRNDPLTRPSSTLSDTVAVADRTFLRRVANDSTSPIYDSTRPAGEFVFAPDQSALLTALSAIATEILRLSQ